MTYDRRTPVAAKKPSKAIPFAQKSLKKVMESWLSNIYIDINMSPAGYDSDPDYDVFDPPDSIRFRTIGTGRKDTSPDAASTCDLELVGRDLIARCSRKGGPAPDGDRVFKLSYDEDPGSFTREVKSFIFWGS